MRTKTLAGVALIVGVVLALGLFLTKRAGEVPVEIEAQHARIEPDAEAPQAPSEPAPGSGEADTDAPASVAEPAAPVPLPRRRPTVRPVTGAPASVTPATSGPVAALEASVVAPRGNEGIVLNALVGHMAGTRGERAFTEGVVEAGYRFSNGTAVGVGQAAKKLYELAPSGENEVIAADTVVFVNTPLSRDFIGMSWQLEGGTTLPVSSRSGEVGHVTRPSLGVRATKIWNERFTISVAPSATYSFNRYVSGGNRVPLERASIGALAEATIAIVPERLSLVAWGKGRFHFYEQFDDRNSAPSPDTTGQYGTFLDLHFNRQLFTQVGWTYGTSLIRDARYDTFFYDPAAHRFYAALGIAL